jgi:hypothetical protein
MRDMRVWYSVALILTIQDELAFARIRMARIYAGMMWSEDILREDVTVVALAELLLWRAPEAASSCLCDLDAPYSCEPSFFYAKREQSSRVNYLKCIRTE